jgi:transposase
MHRRPLKKLALKVKARPDAVVLFFDEGCFGQMPVTGRCWARKGVRPIATVLPGYKNFYVYSAVCPASGKDVTLFLPWVNTEMMNIFLRYLGKALEGRVCLLTLDRAGWHNSKDLVVPDNIELVFLPPYSPELNPVERLWLKRHSLRNRFFRSVEEVMDSVQKCLKSADTAFLKSLCRCDYL